MGATETVSYRYTLTFAEIEKVFDIVLDSDTLALVRKPDPEPPQWTRLSLHKCPNCPLDEARHPHCPAATSLADLVAAFRQLPSFAEVSVRVEGPNRTYSKRASLQEAATPLVALHMVTSGCPVLGKLRPMAALHLPFMDGAETMQRMIGMYLMAQYFRHQDGQPADWDLKGLFSQLREIHDVNVAFCNRLRAVETLDASINAVVRLATLGDVPSPRATQRQLDRLRHIFEESGWRNTSDGTATGRGDP